MWVPVDIKSNHTDSDRVLLRSNSHLIVSLLLWQLSVGVPQGSILEPLLVLVSTARFYCPIC